MFLGLFLVHTLLSGKWWPWSIFSFMPTAAYLLLPIPFIVLKLVRKDRWGLLLAALSLPLVWLNADARLAAVTDWTDDDDHATVFSWNTNYWEKDAESLHAYLRSQDADIYLLQEHVDTRWNPVPDADALRLAFPEHAVSQHKDLLTLSRLPILQTGSGDSFLRTDIEIGGRVVAVYNVHLPPPLLPHLLTRPAALMADMRTRFFRRREAIAALIADMQGISPRLIAGDFNTTKAMRMMSPLRRSMSDSFEASGAFIPATWEIGGMRLLRLDYVLLSEELALYAHETVWAPAMSDHAGLRVRFGKPGR